MYLSRLSINNLAIIENLEVIFDKGLNIITGETGAGKSVLISSLNLILGQKTDTDLIRTGEEKMTVEAEFLDPGVEQINIIKDMNECGNSIVIRREIYRSKRSRIFINDSPSNTEILSQLGKSLIDMHGQHDHQSLLNNDTHINILDEFSRISVSEVEKLYNETVSLRKEIEKVTKAEQDLNDKKELLEYHLKEINEVSPVENEDEDISLELKKMENIEDIKKLCKSVTETAEGDGGSVLRGINFIKSKCMSLRETDNSFEPFINDLESSYQAVKEFSSECDQYANSLEFDEERYNVLSERFTRLKKLMKKFGPALSDVIRYAEEASEQLGSIENIGFDKEKLIKMAAELDEKLQNACAKLSSARQSGAKKFESAIRSEFTEVGLNNAELKVMIADKPVSPDGTDSVEFYIKTNIGEEAKPLSKTASGGEVSRIMLSIKNITGKSSEAEISVFDEIDSGISGRIAEKVGAKLFLLSGSRQVIVITHLPAIASKGNTHFSVRKNISGSRTVVDVVKLDKKQRTEEIASLITGKSLPGSKKIAEDLLN